MLERIVDGRTDLVFEHVAQGLPVTTIANGHSLIRWCAYYGDVSAIRFLVASGESLTSLGDNLDLNGACFHGHWRLCEYLIENGADVNFPLAETGETPLHAALSKTNRWKYTPVVKLLLSHGADPNRGPHDRGPGDGWLHEGLPHQGRNMPAPRCRFRERGGHSQPACGRCPA